MIVQMLIRQKAADCAVGATLTTDLLRCVADIITPLSIDSSVNTRNISKDRLTALAAAQKQCHNYGDQLRTCKATNLSGTGNVMMERA